MRPIARLLACTAIAGAIAGTARAGGEPDLPAPAGTAAIGRMLAFYRGMAEWQLRRELEASSFGTVSRSVGVAAALLTGRPVEAVSAALSDQEPVLCQAPVVGGVNSSFGARRDPFAHRRRDHHNGIDLAAARGEPVYAAGPGVVVTARSLRGYGRAIYIDHGSGIETRYAHLQNILVQEGQFVPSGTLIGRVGSSGHATGPHLHFEVREDGRPVPPLELVGYLVSPDVAAHWSGSAGDQAPAPAVDRAAAEPAPARGRRRHHRATRHGDGQLRSRRPST